MTISKKSIALLMALVLVLGAGIGGTIAWLSDQTKTVTNTFVAGEIGDLSLYETDTDGTVLDATNTDQTHKNFVVVPGVDLVKDPSVSFTPVSGTDANNVPVYVFVKIQLEDGSNWSISGNNLSYTIPAGTDTTALANAMTATVVSGWKPVTGQTGVYYKDLDAGVALDKDPILTVIDTTAKTTIDVSENITKEQIANLAKTNLVFKAYAIQKDGLDTAAAAWAALNPTNP